MRKKSGDNKEQIQRLKKLTDAEVREEAYRYLELDNFERVELKKKGIVMNFLNDGDPNYRTRVGLSKIAESTTTTIAPIKLRNFTEG
jgi:hypothetical protein